MASWIHSPLRLIPAPIDRDAVFAPANKHSHTMTKGERDDEKLLNYTSVFWWDIFKTLFFFFSSSQQSNSPISASLFAFSTSFWARLCAFWQTPHCRSAQLLHPSCFYIPPPVIHGEWGWGCLPPPAVFRGRWWCCVCMCVEVCEGKEMRLAWLDKILEVSVGQETL